MKDPCLVIKLVLSLLVLPGVYYFVGSSTQVLSSLLNFVSHGFLTLFLTLGGIAKCGGRNLVDAGPLTVSPSISGLQAYRSGQDCVATLIGSVQLAHFFQGGR